MYRGGKVGLCKAKPMECCKRRREVSNPGRCGSQAPGHHPAGTWLLRHLKYAILMEASREAFRVIRRHECSTVINVRTPRYLYVQA